ncbi:hypothetical protein HPG69_008436 [Diceros bicornis minor]|uniref:Uncharacterized protein n=1 Tax=Diceros bicornis minor TaxID=77932 RepID=A0A7J7FL67_DICBM|nr:hypothetical protein HPG69_008436 [Diceros bicornis minor]
MERNSSYLLDEPILSAIAKKHNLNPCQVSQHYQLQWRLVVLAKSFSEKRVKENFQEHTGESLQSEEWVLYWGPSLLTFNYFHALNKF